MDIVTNDKRLNRKNFFLSALFLTGVLIFFLVYFIKFHPIMIFDTDDWWYSSFERLPIPLWGDWNPSRVLPEISMNAISVFATYFFYPLTRDYFLALSIAYAIVLSAILTVFIFCVYNFLRRKGAGVIVAIILCYFFLVCHFWIFRTQPENNNYMLKTIDACTHFYYVIPNLLNAILIFWLISYKERLIEYGKHKIRVRRKKMFSRFFEIPLLMIMIYFCMFSNMFAGIISAAYCFSEITIDIINRIVIHKKSSISFIKVHWLKLYLGGLWFTSVIFDINGGRAGADHLNGAENSIKDSLSSFAKVLSSTKILFIICILIIITIGLIFIIRGKAYHDILYSIAFLLSFFVMGSFLMVVCSRTGSHYLLRSDVIYGLFFYIMTIVVLCGYYILKRINVSATLIPLILLVLITLDCITPGRTYANSSVNNVDPQTCHAIDLDILRQMKAAEASGNKKTILYVPAFNNAKYNNWPLVTLPYAADIISAHLFDRNLTETYIEITEIVADPEKNKQFNILIN